MIVYLSGVLRPAQSRAARGLLNWTQVQLAERAGVQVLALRRFEAEKTDPRASTRDAIERALIAGGIELIEEEETLGVKILKPKEA